MRTESKLKEDNSKLQLSAYSPIKKTLENGKYSNRFESLQNRTSETAVLYDRESRDRNQVFEKSPPQLTLRSLGLGFISDQKSPISSKKGEPIDQSNIEESKTPKNMPSVSPRIRITTNPNSNIVYCKVKEKMDNYLQISIKNTKVEKKMKAEYKKQKINEKKKYLESQQNDLSEYAQSLLGEISNRTIPEDLSEKSTSFSICKSNQKKKSVGKRRILDDSKNQMTNFKSAMRFLMKNIPSDPEEKRRSINQNKNSHHQAFSTFLKARINSQSPHSSTKSILIDNKNQKSIHYDGNQPQATRTPSKKKSVNFNLKIQPHNQLNLKNPIKMDFVKVKKIMDGQEAGSNRKQKDLFKLRLTKTYCRNRVSDYRLEDDESVNNSLELEKIENGRII